MRMFDHIVLWPKALKIQKHSHFTGKETAVEYDDNRDKTQDGLTVFVTKAADRRGPENNHCSFQHLRRV